MAAKVDIFIPDFKNSKRDLVSSFGLLLFSFINCILNISFFTFSLFNGLSYLELGEVTNEESVVCLSFSFI